MPTAQRPAVLLVLLQPQAHAKTKRSTGGMGQSPRSVGAPRDLSHQHVGKPGLRPSAVPGTGLRQVDPCGSQTGLSSVPAPASWLGSCRQRHSGACRAGARLSLQPDLLGKAPL